MENTAKAPSFIFGTGRMDRWDTDITVKTHLAG